MMQRVRLLLNVVGFRTWGCETDQKTANRGALLLFTDFPQ